MRLCRHYGTTSGLPVFQWQSEMIEVRKKNSSLSMRWMRRLDWTSPNNYRRAFVRHTDPASQRVRTVSTRIDPNLKPVDLVLTGDHPRGRVGRMMGLVHIVRSVHINVGGIRNHQDTTARVP